MTSINTASDISEWEPSLLASPALPALPMEWWPSCFGAPRLFADRSGYEVMLNDEAGAEAWKIWKFYPSERQSVIAAQIAQLKQLPFFWWEGGLQEDLDVLLNFSQMWVIDDGFSDHAKRREFYESFPEMSQYCGKISKLRKNPLSYVYYAFVTINGKLPEKIPNMLADLPRNLQNYDNLSFQEKTEFTKSIDSAICDYFAAILATPKQ